MTLGVVQKGARSFFACADTRLTYARPDLRLKSRSVLAAVDAVKAVIIGPRICLLYAGDFQIASKCVFALLNSAQLTLPDAIQLTHQFAQQEDGATDFILGAIVGRDPCVFHVAKDFVREVHGRDFIGNAVAYSAFQRALARLHEEGGVQLGLDDGMRSAFESIIAGDGHATVGQFCTQVATTDLVMNGHLSFIYTPMTSIVRARPYTISGVTEHAIDWGGAAEGTYTVSQFGGWYPGREGIAF